MMENIRLFIVTDHPEKAALGIFGRRLQSLPGWVRVMSDHREIDRLDAGAPCMALWFSGGRHPTIAEQAWRERREAVLLDDDYCRHYARVAEWLAKQDAAEKALCAQNAMASHCGEAVLAPVESAIASESLRAAQDATSLKSSRTKWS